MARRQVFTSLFAVIICAISGLSLRGAVLSVPSGLYPTIQAAIDAAGEGDTIVVETGRYRENIDFKGVNVRLTSTDPNDAAVVAGTVIDGAGAGSAVTFTYGLSVGCQLVGFTITGGKSDFGGAINGGEAATVTIDRCVIKNNVSYAGGNLHWCYGTISNCVISNNTTYYVSGLAACKGLLVNCRIYNNTSKGSGVINGYMGEIVNCLIDNNTSEAGGIINSVQGNMINCTIVSNTTNSDALIRYFYGDITNCIIWGNKPGNFYGGAPNISYSCIDQPGGGGTGNTNSDPQFISPDNYHLRYGSPGIDAGDNTALPAGVDSDLKGKIRFYDDPDTIDSGNPGAPGEAIVDMGAYENDWTPAIGVGAGDYVFSTAEGGGNPEEQALSIFNIAGGTLNWSAGSDSDWLKVAPTAGSCAREIDQVILGIDITGLPAGGHVGHVTISDASAWNSPQTVQVLLGIVPEDGSLWVPFQYGTIQGAIDAAGAGDTVIVAAGTYTGAGNRDIDFGGKAITVRSDRGPQSCIIDCQGQGRGFLFHSREEPNSVLEGLTIINGNANVSDPYDPNHPDPHFLIGYGGGICISNSSPMVINCRLIDNEALYGGGICNIAGPYSGYCAPRLIDCTFEDNGTAFTNSQITYGGGMYNQGYYVSSRIYNCEPRVVNCTFLMNQGAIGGGIFNDGGVNILIEHSKFFANQASSGGGIACSNRNDCPLLVNVSNSILVANHVTGMGGGFYCRKFSEVYITNCTISGNDADNYWGAGIHSIETSRVQVNNSILWGNTAGGQADGYSQYYGRTDVTFSCIMDFDPNDGEVWGGANDGNIDDDPLFVREPDDGGDGWGVGDNDDYGDVHLRRDSPCMNRGDSTLITDANAQDMDGQPRIMDLRVDMGADEVETSTLIVTRPIGGEVWVAGGKQQIEWQSYQLEGKVDIFYSINNGLDWLEVKREAANTRRYTWKLPRVDSGGCLVKVLSSDPPGHIRYRQAEKTFTIHPNKPGAAAVTPWPTLGEDYQRRGLSDNWGPEIGYVKWRFDADTPLPYSPTIGAESRIHIAGQNGTIYTLDPNGAEVWRHEIGVALSNSPSLGPDGTIYVGDQNGRFYAIDREGRVRWTYDGQGGIFSTAAVTEKGKVHRPFEAWAKALSALKKRFWGSKIINSRWSRKVKVLIGDYHGSVIALDANGKELWRFTLADDSPLSEPIMAPLTIGAKNTVYVGSLYEPVLYALNVNSGDLLWSCDLGAGGVFTAPVAAADGTIYMVPLHDHHLYAINPVNGQVFWAADLSVADPAWLNPDYGLNQDEVNETFKWYCLSEPAVGPEGTIYVSFDDQYLRAVNPDGTIKWIKPVGRVGGFTLTVGADGLIYAAGDDRTLYVLSPDGEVLSQFAGDKFLSYPVIADDGTMYLSDSEGTLWAIAPREQATEPIHLRRAGDLDGNGIINLVDFSLMAADWLKCSDYFECGYTGQELYLPGDINRDAKLNLGDLNALVNKWLMRI